MFNTALPTVKYHKRIAIHNYATCLFMNRGYQSHTKKDKIGNTSNSSFILSAVFADVSIKNIPFFSAYSVPSFKVKHKYLPLVS